MKNHVFIIAIAAIALGLYFILHSFIPVFSDQLKVAAVTAEQVFTWLSLGIGAMTAISYYLWGKKHRALGVIIGSVIASMGLLIFFKPTFGTLIFNGLLVILLFGSGVFKLLHLKRIQNQRLKIITGIAGVVSILVASVISIYFFKTAKYELLTFLALDITMSGAVLWHLAFADRQA